MTNKIHFKKKKKFTFAFECFQRLERKYFSGILKTLPNCKCIQCLLLGETKFARTVAD